MSLQSFTLADLAQFTREKEFAPDSSPDHRLFYAGRDDLHGILMHLFSAFSVSQFMNMFGYDDGPLNDQVMRGVEDPLVTSVITLDKNQAGGPHEAALLASDAAKDPVGYNSYFVIGGSYTHQISHTKGGVLDGRVGFEGSTNWSTSGEGTFVIPTGPGGPGYKAQNNTLMVFTDPDTVARFTAELVAEHLAAQKGKP